MSSSSAHTREGLVFALIGPAGSGKTTFCERLVKAYPDISLSVSATTRAPRAGEVDGVDYHFFSREQFEQMIKNGDFFEWEDVHGNLYGQLNKTLEQTIYSGKDLLLDIDIRGAVTFKTKLKSSTVICFIAPPSKETLVERITSRSNVSDEELQRRLKTADSEYQLLLNYVARGEMIDYLVVNDDPETTYQEIASQLVAERTRISRIKREYLERICTIE